MSSCQICFFIAPPRNGTGHSHNHQVNMETFSPLSLQDSREDRERDIIIANDDSDQPGDEEQGTSTVFGAAFNFVNSIVGAGIIGIPFAVQQCGFVCGILLLTLVAVLIYHSVLMLIECGLKANKLDFEELSEHLLGWKVSTPPINTPPTNLSTHPLNTLLKN